MKHGKQWRWLALGSSTIVFAILVGYWWLESARLHQAQTAANNRDFPKALEILQPTLNQAWPRQTAILLGARTARRAGEFGQADRFLRKFQERGGDAELIAIERILSSIQRGELGQFGGGIRFCEQHPDHPEVPYVLEAMTIGYMKAGHLVGAFETSSRWLQQDLSPADRAHAYLSRSRCYQSVGNVTQALEDARAAAELCPETPEILERLGELLVDSEPKAAVNYLSKLLQDKPNQWDARVHLARAHRNLTETTLAFRELDHVIATSPRFVPALIERAKLLIDSGDYERAIPDLQNAVALEPRSRSALTQLSRAYQLLGKTREAEDAMGKVRAIEEELFRRIRDAVASGSIPAPPKGTDLTLPVEP